jgi:hypothetical protein
VSVQLIVSTVNLGTVVGVLRGSAALPIPLDELPGASQHVLPTCYLLRELGRVFGRVLWTRLQTAVIRIGRRLIRGILVALLFDLLLSAWVSQIRRVVTAVGEQIRGCRVSVVRFRSSSRSPWRFERSGDDATAPCGLGRRACGCGLPRRLSETRRTAVATLTRAHRRRVRLPRTSKRDFAAGPPISTAPSARTLSR